MIFSSLKIPRRFSRLYKYRYEQHNTDGDGVVITVLSSTVMYEMCEF